MPVGVSIMDDDLRYVEVNETFCLLLGLTRDRILGHRPEDLVSYVDPAQVAAMREDRRRGGVAVDRPVDLIVRHSGRPLHVLYSTSVRRAEGREWVVSTALDITDLHHARIHAERERSFSEALVESHPGLLVVLDGEGRMVRWNTMLERCLGAAPGEWVNRHFRDLVEPDHRVVVDRLVAAAGAGQMVEEELGVGLADGSTRAYLVAARSRELAGRRYLIVSGIDLTARKELQAQIWQSQKMEAMGRLAGGVAHDFNNLLTVISGYVELLALEEPRSDDESEALTQVDRAAARAADLTRQLLAFSRQSVLRPRVVKLQQIVTGVEKMLRRLIGEDVALSFELEPHVDAVLADPGQVEQVIVNLAVNARDAMPGGGRLRIALTSSEVDEAGRVQFRHLEPGRYAVLSVTDTGHGMDAETRAQAFEPFFTTKPEGRGTGLGLATVLGMARQSGGDVTLYSEPGIGTTVRLYLPAVTEGVGEVPTRRRPVARGGTETLLLVEDDEVVRTLLSKHLGAAGYRVHEAGSGPEALRLLHRLDEGPALLLTDVIMPGGMNGPELVEHARALEPGLPAVFMSGYTADVFADRLPDDVAAGLLQKPISRADLLDTVRRVLDGEGVDGAGHGPG
jgi:PAS domain S-box-containing protein